MISKRKDGIGKNLLRGSEGLLCGLAHGEKLQDPVWQRFCRQVPGGFVREERIVNTALSLTMAAALLLALVACGPTMDSTGESAEGGVITTESGLKVEELEEGAGALPQPGDIVSVHYRGTLQDGTEFDNSYNRGEPISFVLGRGMVIPGWDEGIALIKEGGKARLTIPPELAYGEQGAGDVIPPNATLIFEVELVSVRAGAPAAPAEVEASDYVVTDSGLKYYDLDSGDGPSPQEGQTVVVHYTGWLEDGTKFDSSLDRGDPFSFVLGAGRVIQGWDEGVATMKVGGSRQLVIPPNLGYGERGAGEVIPPNAILIFEVELLEIQ
jgi:peptidylprolyl isomerase